MDKIRSHGWDIISPEEAYRDPIAAHIPNELLNNQGLTMSIAKEKGLAGPFCHKGEDREYLDKYVANKGVFK